MWSWVRIPPWVFVAWASNAARRQDDACAHGHGFRVYPETWLSRPARCSLEYVPRAHLDLAALAAQLLTVGRGIWWRRHEKASAAGNCTRVFRVAGGNIDHYSTAELRWGAEQPVPKQGKQSRAFPCLVRSRSSKAHVLFIMFRLASEPPCLAPCLVPRGSWLRLRPPAPPKVACVPRLLSASRLSRPPAPSHLRPAPPFTPNLPIEIILMKICWLKHLSGKSLLDYLWAWEFHPLGLISC